MKNNTPNLRQIILDTETTGLHPDKGDRLIEFAGLEMIDRKLTGKSCQFYIYPECDINAEASQIHGITLETLQDKPLFAAVGNTIRNFIAGAELIIHNAAFDIAFLNMEFKRMGLSPVAEITAGVIDTLALAKNRYPGKRNSLDALCERLEIDRSRRVLHGALIDCALLAQVYLALTHNQFTLDVDLQAPLITMPAAAAYQDTDFIIIKASADELKEHEAYLDDLAKTAAVIYRQED